MEEEEDTVEVILETFNADNVLSSEFAAFFYGTHTEE